MQICQSTKNVFKWHGIHQHRVHMKWHKKKITSTLFFSPSEIPESNFFSFFFGFFLLHFSSYHISWLGCDIIRRFFIQISDCSWWFVYVVKCSIGRWQSVCVVSVFLSISLFVAWFFFFFFLHQCLCKFSFISIMFGIFHGLFVEIVNGALKSALKMRY